MLWAKAKKSGLYARFQTLESGSPRNSGIVDVTGGPSATASFDLEIDGATGRPDVDASSYGR